MNAAPTLTVRREIAASAEELFDAWLDPTSLAVWMRPGDTQRADIRVDARVGGAFEIVMHTPKGAVSHTGTYREISRPRRLVFTWNSPYAGDTDSLVTVEFHPRRGATEIVLTHEGLPNADMVAAHRGGWSDILVLIGKVHERARATG
ncbi:MAG TPA: SRPBCC domain-containing protein [Steroidobacteraceae bacterium]|nr:SRPBCC domain-containing protein [Steroidobacteraceae bacterium]